MSLNTLNNWKEIVYMMEVPIFDIWFVQNIVQTFDGAALITAAQMGESDGTFTVLTNSDQEEKFLQIIEALKEQIPSLSVYKV
ncbi:MAG: hypothetical protein KAH01_07040 [Caldisericia bacterium]|nr:hypothetical protein [Caldisericia bacterium]